MWWFGDFVKDFLAIWIVLDPIAAVPVFMALVADYDERTRARIAGGSVIVALAVLVLAITYGLLRSAGAITRLIGSGGASILRRIMGMILAAYAVTLVLHGVADWLNLPPP